MELYTVILRVPLSIAVILACKLHVFLRKQAAVLHIQKSYRCYFAWKTYSELCSSAITLQTGLRAFGAYNEYIIRKQNRASIYVQVDYRFILFFLSKGKSGYNFQFTDSYFTCSSLNWHSENGCLQACWRCHRDRLNYLKMKRSVLIYQCAWRRRIARGELRKLKMVLK